MHRRRRPATTLTNRQWVLASRPVGAVRLGDFRLREDTGPEPVLHPGQILVRDEVFHLAPTMRNWMNDASRSYRASVGLGEAIIGPGAGRVIGIAGGADKCRWLLDTCHLDGAIDYKSEDVRARLAELCPAGVDVFFDNVGGDILHAVMDHIAPYGRLAVCGQISAYDSDRPAPGPKDMMRVVYWRVRIQGFVLGDFPDDVAAARADLKRWAAEGRIVHRADLREGFENLPAAFLDLFRGENTGTLLVRVAPEA